MNQEKRNSISVTLKDVERFMAKHLTYEHISAGILEKDLLYATGCFVARDSQGVMSFRDIEEPIQVSWFILGLVLFNLFFQYSNERIHSSLVMKLEIHNSREQNTL